MAPVCVVTVGVSARQHPKYICIQRPLLGIDVAWLVFEARSGFDFVGAT